MFAIERLNKIKELLYQEKRVDVFELSELFSVTEATIRRDLDKLEQAGFLIKIYGGAVLNEVETQRPFTADTEDKRIEEKRMIGKIAAQMIENGDAIFLSPGTTTLEIARNLKDKKVTVVTNDMMIGFELRDSTWHQSNCDRRRPGSVNLHARRRVCNSGVERYFYQQGFYRCEGREP